MGYIALAAEILFYITRAAMPSPPYICHVLSMVQALSCSAVAPQELGPAGPLSRDLEVLLLIK